MNLGSDELRTLLRLVDVTQPAEIDCGEFLDRVAGYLERVETGALVPAPEDEDLLQHLRACPECLEEFEALYAVLREQRG
ncbi:MAG: hypothetical protein AAF682_28675 [Planctomycetota bacterium]